MDYPHLQSCTAMHSLAQPCTASNSIDLHFMLTDLHSCTAMHSLAQPPTQLISILCLLISILVLHYDHSMATELKSLVISIPCLLISILVLHYDLIVWYNDIIALVVAKPPVEYK